MPIRPIAALADHFQCARAKCSRGAVLAALAASLIAVVSIGGCTGPREYVHNGFKVGPNYCPPGAQVADNWIDSADKRVRTESEDLSRWWQVFNDPVLDGLVYDAYHQNLT